MFKSQRISFRADVFFPWNWSKKIWSGKKSICFTVPHCHCIRNTNWARLANYFSHTECFIFDHSSFLFEYYLYSIFTYIIYFVLPLCSEFLSLYSYIYSVFYFHFISNSSSIYFYLLIKVHSDLRTKCTHQRMSHVSSSYYCYYYYYYISRWMLRNSNISQQCDLQGCSWSFSKSCNQNNRTINLATIIAPRWSMHVMGELCSTDNLYFLQSNAGNTLFYISDFGCISM